MLEVDLESTLIYRLFPAHSSSFNVLTSTDRVRRAAATAAESEDGISVASLEKPLPRHFDIQDWDRHRRRNFNWYEIFNLADFSADVSLAQSNRVDSVIWTIMRMNQNQYQVPA